jgi:hypothetical protein
MIVLGRHRAVTHDAWSELAVRTAIEEIVTDAIAHFHPDVFWPGHPGDDGAGDGNPSFYFGAAGVIWALDYLHRIGATRVTEDFRPVLPKLLERTITHFESNSPPGLRETWLAAFRRHGRRTPRDAPCSHVEPSRFGACARRSKCWTANPRAYVGHAWVHGDRNPHGRDDTGTAMARTVRNAGGPTVGRIGGDATRSTLDTRSLRRQRLLAWARSRLRRQYHSVVARMGLVDASAANAGD